MGQGGGPRNHQGGNPITMSQENWIHVPPEQEQFIEENAISRYIKSERQAFFEYVLDTAENVVTTAEFDSNAIESAILELENHDYKIPTVTCLCHPQLFADLYNTIDTVQRMDDDCGYISVRAVRCRPDNGLPERTAICVHSNALIPVVPLGRIKPWVVRDGDGVVIIRVLMEETR